MTSKEERRIMLIKDKVCIVTGAASGIGEAVARAYAAGGARGVVVADLRSSRERLAKVAGDIEVVAQLEVLPYDRGGAGHELERLPIQGDLPLEPVAVPGEAPDQRGLARAWLARYRHEIARADREVELAEGGQVAVVDGQPGHT